MKDQSFYFSFAPSDRYIELDFNAPQDEQYDGWTIKPRLKPCRVSSVVYIMCNL